MQQDIPPSAEEGNTDWDFICFEVPLFELADDEDETNQEAEDAPVDKLASLYPDHPWIVSALGRDRANWWLQEAEKRDQGAFRLYFYKWFNAYGKHEVLEKLVSYGLTECPPKLMTDRETSFTSLIRSV